MLNFLRRLFTAAPCDCDDHKGMWVAYMVTHSHYARAGVFPDALRCPSCHTWVEYPTRGETP